MWDYVSLEIQEEIIKRLPIKSVIQFRSVSKRWKSLIDSTHFIAAYTGPHHLLIRYKDIGIFDIVKTYVCLVDDHTFPNQRYEPFLPDDVERLHKLRIVGASHGLFCLFGYFLFEDDDTKHPMLVLWNPSIRKSIAIGVRAAWSCQTVVGFGVSPVTLDPKMVKLTRPKGEKVSTAPWQVEVYTLSSGEWRSVSSNLPHPSVEVTWSQVVLGRFIYWHAKDRIAISDGFQITEMIMSFDMITDEFGEIELPECLAQTDRHNAMAISKVRESLVVLEYTEIATCGIWMMEYGAPNSFTKLYSITLPHEMMNIHGFRKNGEPIIEVFDDGAWSHSSCLIVYDPDSEYVCDSEHVSGELGIFGAVDHYFVNSYMESLLLLNQ